MDFRALKSFLAVAEAGSITKASEILGLSQPALSRQLQELERDVGKILLIRGSKNTKLTEEGQFLRKRAQEILDLTQKTRAELTQTDNNISGDVWVGGGESEGMRLIAKTACSLQREFPNIRIHLLSGNWDDIEERLEKGLVDFGVVAGSINPNKYDFLRLPAEHSAGLLMRKDSPLASHSVIIPNDLQDIPIISSRNDEMKRRYTEWLGYEFDTLNVVATYNLIFNAAFLVEEGFGYALCWDGLIQTNAEHPLCFVPYEPCIKINIDMVWKKGQVFSKASQKFLEHLQVAI